MPIKEFPIIGSYDVQRFKQFSPEDCANWTLTQAPSGKKKNALYPVLGRRHINYLGTNRLIFNIEPRGIFRSINYFYVVVGDAIYRIDQNYNMLEIANGKMTTISSNVFFTYIVSVTITYACFVDGQNMYVYKEPTVLSDGTTIDGEFFVVTDTNAPKNPNYIATFGDRIVVSDNNSSQFTLSVIFLGGSSFDPTTCFTVASSAVFAQASGIIRQFGVLNNTLYIFTDFTTSIWSNIQSTLVPAFGQSAVTFPWKKSSSYDWDFGMADPESLDIDFHRMCWLAKNQDGLVQVMVTDGSLPKRLSTKAIDVLFQRNINTGKLSPFLSGNADGFLYQYENTIYYRLSAGTYMNFGILDQTNSENSIEYNFDTNTWTRCIENNGERCRVQKHIFFNNNHLVTVGNDGTIYKFSGEYYDNEITNPNSIGPNEIDSYLRLPFRYEKVTRIISEDDYSEFITDYVEIDFVFGDNTFINSNTPFPNTVYIVDENTDINGNPIFLVDEDNNETFIIKEGTNTPTADSLTYNKYFKPHVELYWSDDGGINFNSADVREFSQLGVYRWRMRWYQLGVTRNRCYKLVCVSPAPIVVLGGVMDMRRASGGAN